MFVAVAVIVVLVLVAAGAIYFRVSPSRRSNRGADRVSPGASEATRGHESAAQIQSHPPTTGGF